MPPSIAPTFLCSFLLVGAAGAHAAVDLAANLEPLRARHEIPGMVAVVLRGDQIVARGAVGVRKLGAPEKITPDDELHLGSCTKAMTGTLAALLIEDRKLRWDSTLGEIFAATVKDMHPDWRAVTLRQILAHRAGFPNGNIPAEVLDPQIAAADKSIRHQRELVVVHELSRKPLYAPGTKWSYSNVDYIVAAAMFEKVTGQSWEDLMRERIFRPLGMTTAGFGPPGTPGRIEQPWGHTRKGIPVDPGSTDADNPAYFNPAAGARMTMADWAKFAAVHLRGDPANPHRRAILLRPETFADLHAWTPEDNYNAGWGFGTIDIAKGPRSSDRGVIFGHEGSNGKWFSKLLIAPEIDLAVLVVCNRGGNEAEKAVAETALRLLQDFSGAENAVH